MIATRVSRGVALIKISLFIAHGGGGSPFSRGDRPPLFQSEGGAIGCTRRQPGRETNERAKNHRNEVGEAGTREKQSGSSSHWPISSLGRSNSATADTVVTYGAG